MAPYHGCLQDVQGRLWDAVLDGDVEGARAALDAGASLSGPEGSFEAITCRWPLHAAAANNHLEVARLLVERGADVDRLDAVSEPALWHAVEQGHGCMVEVLLELGATASDLPSLSGAVSAASGSEGQQAGCMLHAGAVILAGSLQRDLDVSD